MYSLHIYGRLLLYPPFIEEKLSAKTDRGICKGLTIYKWQSEYISILRVLYHYAKFYPIELKCRLVGLLETLRGKKKRRVL